MQEIKYFKQNNKARFYVPTALTMKNMFPSTMTLYYLVMFIDVSDASIFTLLP
jgi:hypothetical protein